VNKVSATPVKHAVAADARDRDGSAGSAENAMKRVLVFTALFPPLVAVLFIVLVTPDVVSPRDVPEMGLFFFWISGFAYLWAIVPGLLTAGVDWALSEKPLYLRLVATMVVAGFMSVLMARQFGQRGEVLTFAAMGAIPAAVCSWLSGKIK
jgi:hypothetical protein